jgi:hypothetical protein
MLPCLVRLHLVVMLVLMLVLMLVALPICPTGRCTWARCWVPPVPQDWRNKVTGWTEMEADVTALLP